MLCRSNARTGTPLYSSRFLRLEHKRTWKHVRACVHACAPVQVGEKGERDITRVRRVAFGKKKKYRVLSFESLLKSPHRVIHIRATASFCRVLTEIHTRCLLP